MHILSLHYPDDLLITSGKSPQALEAELTFLLAVKLFELRRLSLLLSRRLLQYEQTPIHVRTRAFTNSGYQPR